MPAELNTTLNVITDNIELWTLAIKKKSTTGRGSNKKIELYGIKKLRGLILELAFSGRLVSQKNENSNDLVREIYDKKQTLIKNKVIRKNKSKGVIQPEETRLKIPSNWNWVRLEDIFDVRDGTHDSPKYQSEGFPLVTSKNIYTGKLDLSNVKYISKEDHEKISTRSKVDKFDILFAMIGSIGNPVIIECEPEFSVKNVGLFKYYDINLTPPRYLHLYLTLAELWFKEEASGAVQSFVSLGKLRGFPIPVPPLDEQHRIVAKVDELMSLCDQLESQTEDNIEAHKTLVSILLSTLTGSKDAQELDKNWQRISEHFETLFITEGSIDQLKQAILQLAVMGKLVPQNPTDESASVLLEKIAVEKELLIKDRTIKRIKKMLSFEELELPFIVPENWIWSRLGDLCFTLADGPHYSPNYVKKENGIPFLSTRNISMNSIDLSTAKYVSRDDHELFCKRVRVKKGDIIYTKGGTTGIAKVNNLDLEFSVWVHLAVLQIPNEKINNEYLALALNSPHCYRQSQLYTNGIANKDLGLTRMINITIPFPPLPEQVLIVEKTTQLMAICEDLRLKIQLRQQTQLHLADAIMT